MGSFVNWLEERTDSSVHCNFGGKWKVIKRKQIQTSQSHAYYVLILNNIRISKLRTLLANIAWMLWHLFGIKIKDNHALGRYCASIVCVIHSVIHSVFARSVGQPVTTVTNLWWYEPGQPSWLGFRDLVLLLFSSLFVFPLLKYAN